MRNRLLRNLILTACAALLAASSAMAQEHKWAGRALNDFEWSIHERLAVFPFHGVFDTLNFEVQGKTVVLSGQVTRESIKQNAERVVQRLDGVENVVNQVEVLPASKRDDALRQNVYRAIYQRPAPDEYGDSIPPFIHIIVKDGVVTLEGVVRSDTDRSMVYVRALGVTAHVTDNLRVSAQQ
jgi:hyperosmotically inducible protein